MPFTHEPVQSGLRRFCDFYLDDFLFTELN